jgi:hypothetical protein
MAIVTINDSNLTAIADAIRAKNGTETTYKPSEMAAAISALPTGGGALDFITNTTDYGNSWWESGSSADRGIILPDSITFEDIKFLIGVGGNNNSSVSANTPRHIVYIFCPDLYKRTIQDGEGNIYYACLGTYMSTYSSSIYQGIDFGRGYKGYGSSAHRKSFGWITYKAEDHSIYFYTTELHSSEQGPFEIQQGYMLAERAYAEAIYSLRSGA